MAKNLRHIEKNARRCIYKIAKKGKKVNIKILISPTEFSMLGPEQLQSCQVLKFFPVGIILRIFDSGDFEKRGAVCRHTVFEF
jgi:hypothetical protein